MNGTNPVSLMPRNLQFLLPTREQSLKIQLKSHTTTISDLSTKITSLEIQLYSLKDKLHKTKLAYTTIDRDLALVDGRRKIIPAHKPKANKRKPKPKSKSVKQELKNLNSLQLAELSTALEKLMKSKEVQNA